MFSWIDQILHIFRPTPAALDHMRLGPEDNPNNPLMASRLQNCTSRHDFFTRFLILVAVFHVGYPPRRIELVEASRSRNSSFIRNGFHTSVDSASE